jgi:hypothetical protein
MSVQSKERQRPAERQLPFSFFNVRRLVALGPRGRGASREADQPHHPAVEFGPADRMIAVAVELIEQAVARAMSDHVARRTLVAAWAAGSRAGAGVTRAVFARSTSPRAEARPRPAAMFPGGVLSAVAPFASACAAGTPGATRTRAMIGAAGALAPFGAIACVRSAAPRFSGAAAESPAAAASLARAATFVASILIPVDLVCRGRRRCSGLRHKHGGPRA